MKLRFFIRSCLQNVHCSLFLSNLAYHAWHFFTVQQMFGEKMNKIGTAFTLWESRDNRSEYGFMIPFSGAVDRISLEGIHDLHHLPVLASVLAIKLTTNGALLKCITCNKSDIVDIINPVSGIQQASCTL